MRRKNLLLVAFAAGSALLAKAAAYAAAVRSGDEPTWLSSWALEYRAPLAVAVFGFASVGAVVEVLRAYFDERHEFKRVMLHLLDDCATHVFRNRAKQNRLTIFKVTSGWRAFAWGLIRLPIGEKRYK